MATLVVLAIFVLATLASGTADSDGRVAVASGSCKGSDRVHRKTSRLRRLVLCLHNRERRKRGLSALRSNGDLAEAARNHARDMVRRHYFDHLSPERKTHVERISATGYGDGASFSSGENLLFSGPRRPTPRAIVRQWMTSPGHRHNILRSQWRELGLGTASGAPFAGGRGLTVVAVFATRSP